MTLQPLSELDQTFERSYRTPDAALGNVQHCGCCESYAERRLVSRPR